MNPRRPPIASHPAADSKGQGDKEMKTVTASLTNRNTPSVTVNLNSVAKSAPLTPKIARSAARIAFGHTDGVTVMDGDNGYRLTRNSATKIETEPSF